MTLEHLDVAKQEVRKNEYMSAEISERALGIKLTLPDFNQVDPLNLKLVALDLDGTTLRDDKTFSPRLIAVVKKLQRKGIAFAICSGRAPESVQRFSDVLGLNSGHGYCVCFNGGALINLSDIKKDLYSNTINATDLIDIEAQARLHDCVIHAYSTRRLLLTESNIKFTEMEIASSMQPFEKLHFPDEVNQDEQAYKLIAVGDKEKLDEMRQSLPQVFFERFNIARTHPNFLEFMHKDCSKGATLVHLCQILGITMEQIVSFGDAENDIEMVEMAGVGVAVANAMPTLLVKARYTTYTYIDDGVAIYLEELFSSLLQAE